ncbi:hypothetical protein D9M73_125980 [compost metagenome]
MICASVCGDDQVGRQPRDERLHQDVHTLGLTGAAGCVAHGPARGVAGRHRDDDFTGLQGDIAHQFRCGIEPIEYAVAERIDLRGIHESMGLRLERRLAIGGPNAPRRRRQRFQPVTKRRHCERRGIGGDGRPDRRCPGRWLAWRRNSRRRSRRLGMRGGNSDQHRRREQGGFHWRFSCGDGARLGSRGEPSGRFVGAAVGAGRGEAIALGVGASGSRLQSIAST